MKLMRRLLLPVILLLVFGCGGGEQKGDAVPSGYVPYLVSAPTVTYVRSSWDTTKYDVIVTLQADGPTGVMFASLWIIDVAGEMNFASLELTNIPSTKTWTATTNYYVPLPPGDYYLDDIELHDGDIFTADPLRTGWYFFNSLFFNSFYSLDESETSGGTFPFLKFGVSNIGVVRFTLPPI